MSDAWVIWSEEHQAWWPRPGMHGYTPWLLRAGRYSEEQAKSIEADANRHLPTGKVREVAMPDPVPAARKRLLRVAA